MPLHIKDERLLGGLDLSATLQSGRPVAMRGLLAEADGGVVLLAMAERLPAGTCARLAAVIDTGAVVLERDGVALTTATRFGVVALDEGVADDEAAPVALADRLAFHLDLSDVSVRDAYDPAAGEGPVAGADDLAAARALLPRVRAGDDIVEALTSAALTLGIASIRATLLALRVARAAAALAGRDTVLPDDATLAARLVLAPRATTLPPGAPEQPPEPPPEPPEAEQEPPDDDDDDDKPDDEPDAEPEDRPEDEPEPDEPLPSIEDLVLAAARASIPAGLLARLKAGDAARSQARTGGKAGALQQGATRGRPAGTRRGEPRAGARLNVVETLRAAAPWQKLRRAAAALEPAGAAGSPPAIAPNRIHVRPEDFHVTRFQQRSETTTIFVVDASGSSALNRLAEAKGAVELLLADCYVRRDRVAVLSFRGRSAELLLPPTRSLVRAKRSLAALPGGGGTPLAHGIDAAAALADAIRRRGETPIVVMLTDGRGNIARDGSPGRARAEADALTAARQVRAQGFSVLMVDTSPQPYPQAARLAEAMRATYVPLPYAGAQALSTVVKATVAGAGRKG